MDTTEQIRQVKITVCVDTNKTTYQAEFESIEAARAYLRGVLAWIYPSEEGEE